MRILIISPFFPWPPNAGGNVAQLATLQCLQANHEFTLVVPVYSESQLNSVKELQIQLPKVKVRAVFCGKRSRSKVADYFNRAVHRLKSGWRKLFFQPKAAPKPALFYPFNPLRRELVLATAEELANGPDAVQVEFTELLPLAASLPVSLPKIFIHHQVHFRYAEHFLEAHGADPYSRYLAEAMRVQELAYLKLYNGIVVFSALEQRELEKVSGMPPVFTSPFPYPAGTRPDHRGNFENKFTFIGSGKHDPNHDALSWLRRQIWPFMRREMPDAKLQIIGEWDESWQKKFRGDGIEFTGFIEDLGAALQDSIMLVPLRIGGGIRTKILAALALGIPVVATRIGAEGLLVDDGADLLLRDDAEKFAAAAVKLARESSLREKLAANGLATVEKHYSPERVRIRRNEIYAEVVNRKAK